MRDDLMSDRLRLVLPSRLLGAGRALLPSRLLRAGRVLLMASGAGPALLVASGAGLARLGARASIGPAGGAGH